MVDVLNKIMGGLLTAVGATSLIGAAWALTDHLAVEEAKAAALAAGAPTVVQVERFKPSRDVGPAGEVALRGRMRFDETKVTPSLQTGWIAPLYAAEDEAATEPVAFAVAKANETARPPGAADLAGLTVIDKEDGGSLVLLSGVRVDPSLHFDALRAAKKEINRFNLRVLVFEPFPDGREAALSPNHSDSALRAAYLALSLGMLSLGVWLMRRDQI